MYEYLSGVWDYLSNLTKPYEGETEETLEKEWDWVESATEEYCNQLTKDQIRKDLLNLKFNGKMIRSRNIIRRHCQSLIYALSDEERETLLDVKIPLDSLSCLMKKFVEIIIPKWQNCLRAGFPDYKEFFSANWQEGKYEKNVSGHLIALASCASRSINISGLDERRLCDIMWSIRLALKSVIISEIKRDLDSTELNGLTNIITPVMSVYLNMHLDTANALKKTIKLMGNLPERWREEDLNETIRLEEIKLRGADGAYKDGDIDKFVKGESLISQNNLKAAQQKLQFTLEEKYGILSNNKNKTLVFIDDETSIITSCANNYDEIPSPPPIPPVMFTSPNDLVKVSTNFKQMQQVLEEKLNF